MMMMMMMMIIIIIICLINWMSVLCIAAGLQAMLKTVLYGDFRRKFVKT